MKGLLQPGIRFRKKEKKEKEKKKDWIASIVKCTNFLQIFVTSNIKNHRDS